jgi:hypothetical protein
MLFRHAAATPVFRRMPLYFTPFAIFAELPPATLEH